MNSHAGSHLVEDKVVCPHCWHNFYGDDAWHISQHPELFGDDVLGENQRRRFAPNEAQRDRDGNVLDAKGWRVVDRACPRCHLQLPPELLTVRPWFISIVGAGRCGKTYFLTSMLHELRKESAAFNYAFDLADSHDVCTYVDYVNRLFFPEDASELTWLEKTREDTLINEVFLDGTRVRLPKPFIFYLRPIDSGKRMPQGSRSQRRSVVLYDNPGEAFEFQFDRHVATDRHTQHLAESDAVLFVFDPLLDPNARRRLKEDSLVPQDPQLARLNFHRQEHILSAVVNRIRRHRKLIDGTRITVPLAVCVQKCDVWNRLVPHGHVIDHTSVVNLRDHGIAALDTEEINAISLLVRSLLQDICPEFVATAEANFATVRYFPVSAIGTSPQVDGDHLKVRPDDIKPYRVSHPVLWLLYRWGLIFRATRRSENPRSLPVVQIKEVTHDRIHVVLPAGLMVSLDREYAGSSVVDPYSGESLWIPKIESQAAINEPPAPSPIQPPEDLRLTLDDAKAPISRRKRRWFGSR
ncbi:MAG: hypothetical protein GXY83_40320 [Rhodopirellula sp.]|nr:hypothetical protein [Rhodopirellula sp.]